MAVLRNAMIEIVAGASAPACGQYFIVDTESTERPPTLINLGDLCYAKDTNKMYRCTQISPSVVWTDLAGAGAGEANTASNVGASGVGVFHQKTGVDLELRKVDGINGITAALNTAKIDVAPTYGSSPNTICQGNDARLSDARTPTAHATSHKSGGSDPILLNEFGLPTGSVNFNDQQATSFRFENRTSDPGTPTVGQCWLRTDL